MDIALATLLVSSLSCVGLLALWAATSPRHWFLRTVIFLGVISLLLLIPAYEPWVVFVLQGALVAGGVQLYRWRFNDETDSTARARFSMATMLQMTTIFAVVITVGFRAYQDEWTYWPLALANGVSAGLVTLLAIWIVRGKKHLLNLGVLGIPCLLVCSAMNYWWEPQIIASVEVYENPWGFSGRVWHLISWFFFTVCLIVVLVTVLLLQRRTQSFVLSICLLILFTPLACVFYLMLTPTPIPEAVSPQPNGFLTLVEVGQKMECREINNWDTTAINLLSKEVQGREQLFKQAEQALAHECSVPLEYTMADLSLDYFSQLRALGRGFAARARIAASEEKFEDAAESVSLMVELGTDSSNGGLLVNWLVGTAIRDSGYSQLYEFLPHLEAEQCLRFAQILLDHEEKPGDYEDIVMRDRVWSERAQGPYNHLAIILADMVGIAFLGHLDLETPRDHGLAKSRLLRSELALRAYIGIEDKYPVQLEELVPKYLDAVPIDPFDPDGATLRYLVSGEGYVVYSVGQDRYDNGGVMERDPNSYSAYDYVGDYRLDIAFSPDPNEADPNSEIDSE